MVDSSIYIALLLTERLRPNYLELNVGSYADATQWC